MTGLSVPTIWRVKYTISLCPPLSLQELGYGRPLPLPFILAILRRNFYNSLFAFMSKESIQNGVYSLRIEISPWKQILVFKSCPPLRRYAKYDRAASPERVPILLT